MEKTGTALSSDVLLRELLIEILLITEKDSKLALSLSLFEQDQFDN